MVDVLVKRAMVGGLWLSMIEPGWAETVDWDALDLESATMCVAGQVFADRIADGVFDGYDYLMSLLSDEDRAALGFTAPRHPGAWLAPYGNVVWADAQAQAWRRVWAPSVG